MTDSTPQAGSTNAAGPSATTSIAVTASEAQLLQTALQLLLDTLGRDEADELTEVQALLAKVAGATKA